MSFILKCSPFLTNLDSLPPESMSAIGGEFSTDDIGDFTTDFHRLPERRGYRYKGAKEEVA